ncbi:MAG TPA: PEP/pyruvate-binding domain-containing protein [Steroidobacteraceae bacterium]|nr:PEP/pyruvate-binding domain-containing protein [Steroidobacteraceae bacterium]
MSTGDRNPQLSNTGTMQIAWFETVRIASRPTVGGKGASLGELTHAGIRVPPGFVVTTHAFESSLAALDAAGAIRREIAALDGKDLDRITETARSIRERIESAPLPSPLQLAITEAHAKLCGGNALAPVAVRSSATSEDSAEASFAGQQETLLWVRGADAVLKALRSCWASLYSVESVSYRMRLTLEESRVAMGVVIQRMVDSRASGVMFTRSPTSGDPSVISIEGSWGLGSAIVSGEVTPDRFVVSKVTGEVVRRDLSEKLTEHLPAPCGQGIHAAAIPPERQSVSCLADSEITGLVDLAKRVELHYGAAQDIEWAVARDGAIYLLQSRPETVWSSRDVKPVAAPKANPFDHVLAALSGKTRS